MGETKGGRSAQEKLFLILHLYVDNLSPSRDSLMDKLSGLCMLNQPLLYIKAFFPSSRLLMLRALISSGMARSLASSFSHTLPDFSLPSLACSAPAPRFLCFITRGGHRYWRQSRVQAAQGDGHQPELAPAAPQRCSRAGRVWGKLPVTLWCSRDRHQGGRQDANQSRSVKHTRELLFTR